VGIGGALAEARSAAGLTVTQVSQRTRIRETIIRDIERDDYAACGGDFYARGHIRAIARVVGTDPVPLIEEYDAAHRPPPDPVDVSDASQTPGWRMPGWHRHQAGGSTGHVFEDHNGNAAAPPSVTRNGSGSGRFTTDGAATPVRVQADEDTDPGISLTAVDAGPQVCPDSSRRADSRRPDSAAADGPADGGPADRAPADRAPGDTGRAGANGQPAADRMLAEPALNDTASDDADVQEVAARDTAVHDTSVHDTAVHDTAVHDTAMHGTAPADGGSALLPRRGNVSWAASARSRLARAPEPEGSGVPGGITAAEAFRPVMPLQPRRTGGRGRLLIVAVLAVIGLLIYLLVSGGSPSKSSGSTHHNSTTSSGSHHGTKGATSPSASASASSPPAPSAGPLTVASAAAFGPSGAGQGDNPGEASLAIDGNDSTDWQTDWYATSNFSGMQSGTGLLLDLGHSDSITEVKVLLGAASGGTIQLRAGDSPTLADLPPVAAVPDSGGLLTVKLSAPATAQYLLIWFTSLPPDNSGTYQASIYNVSVLGTS